MVQGNIESEISKEIKITGDLAKTIADSQKVLILKKWFR